MVGGAAVPAPVGRDRAPRRLRTPPRPAGWCVVLSGVRPATESPGRLAAKLEAYGRIGLGSDRPDALVFCFPDPIRETSARRRLHGVRGLVVTTGSWDRVGPDPLGAVWLPTGSERRVRLVDLATMLDHAFEARHGGSAR
jgi:hypothetical protein